MIQRFSLLLFSMFFFNLCFLVFDYSAFAARKPKEERLTVVLKDFSVQPNTTEAQPGTLTFEAVNEGMSTHELVILKTDLKPAALPRKEAKFHQGMKEYLVNEDDARIKTIDEIEEFQAGTTQEKTVVLEPGHYVLFCNIPGHYDKGMYSPFHIMPK